MSLRLRIEDEVLVDMPKKANTITAKRVASRPHFVLAADPSNVRKGKVGL